ncbi:type II secretion system F family protein [Idiomarina seosinensis]|uniref:Type II secretion system protein GspF domain-containing protein n=1 Tax=Idiomarina seosinensis TaxID=281739 RepID=A0A432ZH03_9GAMM|nr:type II secretion system F family protein [Idiomarina seosinensis]RUO77266.1 hypothetical protein CWI81_01910 [Idiomarina seosinensis]
MWTQWLVAFCLLLSGVFWGTLLVQFNKQRLKTIEGALETNAQRSMQEFFLYLPARILVRLYLCLCLLGPLLGWLLGDWFSALICLFVVVIAPPMGYRWLLKRRYRALQKQLPPMLVTLSNQLRSGISLANGIRGLKGELAAPLGQEVNEILRQVKLGQDLEAALLGWQHRMPIFSVKMVVQSLILGFRSGGQQSDLLMRLADNLQKQEHIRERQATLSSQAKMQARILVLMPVALFFLLRSMKPDHIAMLTDTLTGQLMLVAAAILMMIGGWMMKKILNTDDF